MGRSTCYIAASMAAYVGLRERDRENWKGLHALVGGDELHEWLNSNVDGGIEFVEDLEDDRDELDCGCEQEWFARGKGMTVMDVKGDDMTWMLRWHSPGAKLEWFRPHYERFRQDVDHYVNHNFGLEDFAKWESLNPPWKLEKSYERFFGGRVIVLDARGFIEDISYPMEFLRLVEPGQEWALSKIGWLYK